MSRLPPPHLQRVDTMYGNSDQTGLKSFTFVFKGKPESLRKMEMNLKERPDSVLNPEVTLQGDELHVTKKVDFMDWVRVTKPGEPETPQSILLLDAFGGISDRRYQNMNSEIEMKHELLASIEARTEIDYRMKLEATTWPVQNEPIKRNPVVTITFDQEADRSAVTLLQGALQERMVDLMMGGFGSSAKPPEIVMHGPPEEPRAAQVKAEAKLKAVRERLGLDKQLG